MRIRSRIPLLALAALVAGPARAETTFKPSLSLRQTYTDNVGYASVGERSDTATQAILELPVRRQWRSGNLDLRYTPSYFRHDEFEALDRDEHRLALSVEEMPGPRSNLALSTSWVLTQEGGDPDSTDASDLFVARRADRQTYRAELSYGHAAGPRWRWDAAVGGARRTEEAIDDTALARTFPGDRTDLGGRLRISRVSSRTSSWGLEVEHRRFDLDPTRTDTTGDGFGDTIDESAIDSSANLAGWTWTRQVSRGTTIDVLVGGYTLDEEAQQVGVGIAETDDAGFHGRVAVAREYRNLRLQLDATHTPTSGGFNGGTSVNTTAGLALSGQPGGVWGWRTALRYGRREPSELTRDGNDRTAAVATASVTRRFGQSVGLTVGAGYTDQSVDGAEPSAEGEWSALTAHFGLVWYPWGPDDSARR